MGETIYNFTLELQFKPEIYAFNHNDSHINAELNANPKPKPNSSKIKCESSVLDQNFQSSQLLDGNLKNEYTQSWKFKMDPDLHSKFK